VAEARADGGEGEGAVMECDAFCNPARPALEGRVLYTLGGGLDHPLDIIRLDWYNDVIVPVYSWRRRAVTGFCVNSSQFCAQDFTWPAQTENAQFDDPPVTDPEFGGPVAWGGNIIDTQQDGSGLVYKRNRYYDPASGRFTQVDPIGLGGGLSAYGFGGGDQVSFTDPFGLCKGIEGTDQNSNADCPQSMQFGLQMAAQASAINKAVGVAGAVAMAPIVIMAVGDAVPASVAESFVSYADRKVAIQILKGHAAELSEGFESGEMPKGITKEVLEAYQKVARYAVQNADKLDKAGVQAKRLVMIAKWLAEMK
jgi:RHS repeat-associated protein